MGGVGGRVVTEEVKQRSRNEGMPTFSDLQWDPQADREHSAGLECDSHPLSLSFQIRFRMGNIRRIAS